MHPQAFLKTFWRMQLRPQVFVAMSFAPEYATRFKEVIEPAIQKLNANGKPLEAYRVDISKSGDSIISDIVDGISHSQLVLADVSTIGHDSKTGRSYRNANVLYEVGIALACRHPSEVLLVRDDRDQFLFDVSTIPHVTIDFTDKATAKEVLVEQLSGRLREQRFQFDARVNLAIHTLSGAEVWLINRGKDWSRETVWGQDVLGISDSFGQATQRLLDKGVVCLAGKFTPSDKPAFRFTEFGIIVRDIVNKNLRCFSDPVPDPDIEVKAEVGRTPDNAPE